MNRRPAPRTRLAGLVALAGAAGFLTGCGDSAVTDLRVEQAVRTSFDNLYVLQQRQRGLPVDQTRLNTVANCLRDDPDDKRTGPGEDWVCNIKWRTRSATTGAATYSLTVRADGCYTAEGEGPLDLNGTKTVVGVDGETVLNPLWAFDGCFPLA